MNYTIRPLADGYAIYKDGVYVMWCFTEDRAKLRLSEIQNASI